MKRTMHCGRLATIPLTLVSQVAIAQQPAPTQDFPRISFATAVEVEAYHLSPYTGGDESDVVLATGAFGLEAEINEWVSTEASVLYEENDTPLEIDTASVILGAEDSLWTLRAGQFYVPFGLYGTAMLSDPLTLELGETRETAIAVGIGQGDLSAVAYVFNGDLESEDQINGFGATGTYEGTIGAVDVTLSTGYMNSLGESDALQETVTAATGGADTDAVGAWTAGAVLEAGQAMLVGEYLAATDAFDVSAIAYNGGGAQPSVWNLEASYGLDLLGKPARAGIGYQGTEESVALELPQSRVLVALSIEILPHTALSFEYAHDEDYGTADGGTGESAGTFTTQLAVVF